MSTEDIKRLSYYEKQFLRARDFQDEQAYHIEMRRRHLIAHHSWGIVVGLDLKQDPTSKTWWVQPGIAVDGFGREIVVSEAEPLDIGKIGVVLGAIVPPVTLKLWIQYELEKTDRPAPGYEACSDGEQFIRIRETFRLLYADNPPTPDQTIPPQPYENLSDDPIAAPWPVLLGTVTWGLDPADATKRTVIAFDPAGRRYTGLVGAEITTPDFAQPVPSGTAVKAILTVRAEETRVTGKTAGTNGLLAVDGNVEIDGGQLDLRATGGGEAGAPLRAFRSGTKDFRIKIGDDPSQNARFVVGAGTDNKFVVEADGDVALDGELTIKNSKDISLEGGRLALKNADGSEAPDITDMSRKDNLLTGHKDLRLGIGSPGDLGARLVVGPKNGDVVTESLVVENDGDVIVGNRLTVKGFSLTHRGSDVVISGRTGGNPRALVDVGDKLAINFSGDYTQGVAIQSRLEVQGNLQVQGNINPTGLVDGRDVAADGATLDALTGITVKVRIGEIAHGGTIPLPGGAGEFTQGQCQWLVSPASLPFAALPSTLECSASANREVVVRWRHIIPILGGIVDITGTANYIIIGVK